MVSTNKFLFKPCIIYMNILPRVLLYTNFLFAVNFFHNFSAMDMMFIASNFCNQTLFIFLQQFRYHRQSRTGVCNEKYLRRKGFSAFCKIQEHTKNVGQVYSVEQLTAYLFDKITFNTLRDCLCLYITGFKYKEC
jgi:hypothetical protein